MSETSANSNPPTATTPRTSSPGSADGRSRFGSPDGLQHDLFGRAPVRVNRSARRVAEKALTMRATCGPPGSGSSVSAALQRSLASRLRVVMEGRGSPLYALTWKAWAMPWGEPICALRASALRTKDSGYFGWPSASATDWKGSSQPGQRRGQLAEAVMTAPWATPTRADERRVDGGTIPTAGMQAKHAHWPSPKAEDTESTGMHRGSPDTLTSATRFVPWPTPNTMDARGGTRKADGQNQVCFAVHGLISNGCSAATPMGRSTGQLNPEFSRWLMGFPEAWARSDPNWRAWRNWQGFLAKVCAPRSGTGEPKSPATGTP